jgi:uncharacterized HAD superfamily protein
MNEVMLRIGIDIDDVLADSMPEYLSAFNRRFGLQIPVTEAGWEMFRRHPDISAEEIRAFFGELYEADFLGSRPLLPGAREGVERLHRAGHRLFIITGRLRSDRDITERWIETRGLSSFFQEIIDRDGLDAPRHKRQAADQFRLDVLLEDEYEVALVAAEARVQVLLFNRPWNQGPVPSQVLRIHSWPDAVACLGRQGRSPAS